MSAVKHPEAIDIHSHVKSGFVRKSNTIKTAAWFHNLSYAMFVCSGILEMRHIGQLEMRQSSPLGMLVERQHWEA
ncbi:hypothetical protein, partial [Rhizobium sullae]|uniref:hypothetical protein n=1 Tax=Rhizobium sullae TaxID=50338 RepID=UPI001A9D9F02